MEETAKCSIPAVVSRMSQDVAKYSDDEKAQAVEYAFSRMEDGSTLIDAARDLGVSNNALWYWINRDLELKSRYEELKVVRSRHMIEDIYRDLITFNADGTWEDMRKLELKSRLAFKLAALMNPTEYSEKIAPQDRMNMGGGAVSFTLNFGQSESASSVTIDAQPQRENEG